MQIDKNVPIPTSTGRGRPAGTGKHPLNSLAVGESILCPPENNPASVRMLVQYHQRISDKRYTTRTTPQGLRVWRIK